MNVYKFECVVWVRGESAESALKELRDEVEYRVGLDNNLIAIESYGGQLVEDETTKGESK